MKKICLVKTSSLGDIVHIFPVVSYLKDRYSEVLIDWVVEENCRELVSAHPQVHRAVAVQTKRWRQNPFSKESRSEIAHYKRTVNASSYDIVFDLQGNLKSGLLTSLIRSSCKVGFSLKSVPEWPNTLFTHKRFTTPPGKSIQEDYLNLVKAYFGDERPYFPTPIALNISEKERAHVEALTADSRYKILVSPGSAWRNKQLKETTLLAFLKKIEPSLNCQFLFAWGSKEEQAQATALHEAFVEKSLLLPKLPLAVLQNLMGKVDLVIAMDSLPLHLAGSAGTATFSFFGPSLAAKYRPLGSQHSSFQGSCPYGRTFEKRCPVLRTCPTGACLRDVQLEEVLRAWLGRL